MTREPDGDYYEPDSEECALMIAEEKELTSLRSGYHEADRGLRDYRKHTDRQLRGFYKEKKACASGLRTHHFDVVDDSFEIEIADDVYETLEWPYDDTYYGPPAPTRKDKRRERTKRRRADRELRTWMEARRRNPVRSSVVRKTGALVSAVAA